MFKELTPQPFHRKLYWQLNCKMNKYIFETITSEFGESIIKRTDEDGNEAWIPMDPSNSDYAKYLATLEQETQ